MPLIVRTSRLPHHGQPGYVGPDALNVTRGSGGDAGNPFAPSRALLDEANRRKRASKRDEAALEAVWAWYAPLFLEEMRASYRQNRPAWEALLARESVVLLCYCGTHSRCHRRLLAEILVKLGAVDEGEINTEKAPTFMHGRVIVCGSREAKTDHADIIRTEIVKLPAGIVIAEGECDGVDKLARQIAEQHGYPVERWPVDWDAAKRPQILGRRWRFAGPLRNAWMFHAAPVDLVLAFPMGESKGTRDMIRLAHANGVPVRVVELTSHA